MPSVDLLFHHQLQELPGGGPEPNAERALGFQLGGIVGHKFLASTRRHRSGALGAQFKNVS
jgi:hypothetical protein